MKKSIAILSLMTALTGLNLGAQQFSYANGYSPEVLAERLIKYYDVDGTGALNELELSTAVDYISLKSFNVYSNPELAGIADQPSSPKVAVSMRKTFDLNEDFQLCEDELAVAISDLTTTSS